MKSGDEHLARAAKAEAEGRMQDALAAIDKAIEAATDLQVKFDALLFRARTEGFGLDLRDKALATYWEARHLTRGHRLGRAGEADLGIGMMLIDLDRKNEGLEAIRRSVRYFRKRGNTYLRGCSEALLADIAIAADNDSLADKHLEVATDLLKATAEPRMVSSVLTMRAGIRARRGEDAAAEAFLKEAAKLAIDIHDEMIEGELQTRRRKVRALIAEHSLRGPRSEL